MPPNNRTVFRKYRAYRFGLIAEQCVIWHFRLRGYRILARRHRTPAGEIDIIAQRRKLVVFIEVKARRKDSNEVLGSRQIRRITQAATLYIAKRPELAQYDIRFDLAIVQRLWPKITPDAWQADRF